MRVSPADGPDETAGRGHTLLIRKRFADLERILAQLEQNLGVLLPLWLGRAGLPLPLEPLAMAIATALGCIFGLGLFLGRVGGTSPLGSGFKAVLIALVTIGLVYYLVRKERREERERLEAETQD